MSAPNFELITELQVLLRRDFSLYDPTLLKPTGVLPLIDGEFVSLDANYKIVRGSATANCFPVHTERGRYDTQSLGKANVIFAGQYEAETSVLEGVSSGFVVGMPVKIAIITGPFDGRDNTGRYGLKVCGGAGGIPATTEVVFGVVTKVDAVAKKVRFLHMATSITP